MNKSNPSSLISDASQTEQTLRFGRRYSIGWNGIRKAEIEKGVASKTFDSSLVFRGDAKSSPNNFGVHMLEKGGTVACTVAFLADHVIGHVT